MKIIVISAIFMVIAGCDLEPNYKETEEAKSEIQKQPESVNVDRMRVFHDDQRNVTCWLAGSGTLSCWPDWMLSAQGVKP